MEDVYRRLAARLDELPHGFPPAPDGVELRLLAKIFSPEDAALALRLMPSPETAAAVARRAGLSEDAARGRLDAMAARGEILALGPRGARRYALMPFIFGIYEFQLERMDAELAALVEAYMPTLAPVLGGSRPALGRVVPVGVSIEARATILSCRSVEELIEGAQSILLSECVCRVEREALGKGCGHLREACFALSPEPNAFSGDSPRRRVATRAEALDVLARAEREGLVHCTYNVREDPIFICNCCRCCCGFLRGLAEFGAPHVLANSGFVAAPDAAACGGCGACVARCPTDALALVPAGGDDARPRIALAAERCIGCGLCASVCKRGALTLVARPAAEIEKPPRDVSAWYLARARSRFGLLGAAASVARFAARAARRVRPVSD